MSTPSSFTLLGGLTLSPGETYTTTIITSTNSEPESTTTVLHTAPWGPTGDYRDEVDGLAGNVHHHLHRPRKRGYDCGVRDEREHRDEHHLVEYVEWHIIDGSSLLLDEFGR
jgi:hypothetical protein